MATADFHWERQEGRLGKGEVVSALTDERVSRGAADEPEPDRMLAVFLKPLIVLNTQKWFGAAELRLDALVVHGGEGSSDLYHPKTFRFPQVSDGDDLAKTADENGILVYYGKPAHFIAMSIMLSRDPKDSEDLADLIRSRSTSLGGPLKALAAAQLAAPQVALVQAGVTAALELGDLAFRLVRELSPSCLGLYRCAWLGNRDAFGEGRHPARGIAEVKDFQFAYQIAPDEKKVAPLPAPS